MSLSSYAFLYDNTDYTEALLHLYELTGRSQYLARARTNLLEIIERLDEDFRYVRRFPSSNNFYTGMAQGIILQAVDFYLRVSPQPDPAMQDALLRLSTAFTHTTEGVWNHAANSYMGQLIANRALNISPDIPARFFETLDEFHQQVESFDGRIPYVKSKSHSLYPAFKSTYQTYDTMLFARLSTMLPQPLSVMDLFAQMHTVSQEVNYSHYGSRNMYSLMWANQGVGYIDDAFAAFQENQLRSYNTRTPASNKVAIGQLQMTAAILKYYAQRTDQTPEP